MTDPSLCPDCGATRTWVWSQKQQRQLLRRCPCQAPKGDKSAARERIAAIRAEHGWKPKETKA